MIELIKRNRTVFEFILFLFLVGLSSGIGLTATGLFAPFGLSLLALFGAGALLFGIFMIPLLVIVPYIRYCESAYVKKQKSLAAQRQKQDLKSQEPLRPEEIHKVKEEHQNPQAIEKEGQESESEISFEVKAFFKIKSVLERAPKKFPLTRGSEGGLRSVSSGVTEFQWHYEEEYYGVEKGNKIFRDMHRARANLEARYVTPMQRLIACERVDFFIQFMQEVFKVKLDRKHQEFPPQVSSGGQAGTDSGYYFCRIDSADDMTKIMNLDPKEAEKKAAEFYKKWEVKEKFDKILARWIESIKKNQERKGIAIDIARDILKHSKIKREKHGFSLNYNGKGAVYSSEWIKVRDDLFKNLKAYLEAEQKDTVLAVNLEYVGREGSTKLLPNLTVQIKGSVKQNNKRVKEELERTRLEETRVGEAIKKLFVIFEEAPEEFPLNENSLLRKNITKEGLFYHQDNPDRMSFKVFYEYAQINPGLKLGNSFQLASDKIDFFMSFMNHVFDIELSSKKLPESFDSGPVSGGFTGSISGGFVCEMNSEKLDKIIALDINTAKKNAAQFYQKLERDKKIKTNLTCLLEQWVASVLEEQKKDAAKIKKEILSKFNMSETKQKNIMIHYNGSAAPMSTGNITPLLEKEKKLFENLKTYFEQQENTLSVNLTYTINNSDLCSGKADLIIKIKNPVSEEPENAEDNRAVYAHSPLSQPKSHSSDVKNECDADDDAENSSTSTSTSTNSY